MSLTALGTTITFSRTQGIPSGGSFAAFNFGQWFYFIDWPASQQLLMSFGPESQRAEFGVNSSGEIYLTLDGSPKGTTAALELGRWYFIAYCKTTSTTHTIRTTYLDPATGLTTSPVTALSVTYTHAATTALAFEVYLTSDYRICNTKFQPGLTVSPSTFMGDRDTWLPTNQVAYMWCPFRTPLDTSSQFTGVAGAHTFTDKHFWDVIDGGTLVRRPDPSHLLDQPCAVSYYQEIVGGQLSHDPLPPLSPAVEAPAFIGWRPEDDGRVPVSLEITSSTFDADITDSGGGLLNANTEDGLVRIPFLDGASYACGENATLGYQRGGLGSFPDGMGGTPGNINPATGNPLVRADLFDFSLSAMVLFGPNGNITTTACRTWIITGIGLTVYYIGDYDAYVGDPTPVDESVPCCESTCPCPPSPVTTPTGSPASGPIPTSTGPVLPPVNTLPTSGPPSPLDPPYWDRLCAGAGTVPTASDPVDAESWVRV